MNKNNLVVWTGALAVLSSNIAVVQAQESRFQLEEVVVTAQKREQSQQDVPIAITAVSAADIERIGATEIKDIQFSTPNLVISGSNPVQQSYGIRGIADRGRNPGYDQRIGVYVDGVWVGKSAASNQSALDLQSVEILRGPQGTLFGKNTVAGAINITTQRPDDNLGGYLQVEAGNYGQKRAKGSVNVPLSDTLKAKISLSTDTRDGYYNNLASNPDVAEYNDKDQTAMRAQLLWDAGSDTEILFTVDHMESDANDVLAGERTTDALAPDVFDVNINSAGAVGVDGVGGVSFQVGHSFDNGFELTSISAYRYEDWFFSGHDEDYTPLNIASSGAKTESSHFTQEIRLSSPLNEKYDYVLGLFYLDQDIEGQGDAQLDANILTGGAVPISEYLMGYDATVNVNSWAAFVHGNYRIADDFQLTAGLRYTSETKDLDYNINDPLGIFFANGTATDSRKSDDLSPKATLTWFFSEEAIIYASYSRAFKSGGFNADFIADLDGLEFDDETVDAFELGLKSTWLDERLRLNMAVFESNHSDYQVQAQTPISGGGSILTVSNAGALTSKGFEMDLQLLVSESFRVWGSYGYTDAEFEKFDGCSIGGGVGSCSGNRPVEAPKVSYNFGMEATMPVMGGEGFVNVNYFWRDEMYSNPNNEKAFLNEEYNELAGRIGWNSGSDELSVYLWGKNLTNETTQTYNSVSFLGAQRSVYNPPRTYGVALRWNFNG